MAKHEFKHYLHNGYSGYEMADWISEQTGVEIGENDGPDSLADKIGRPFYEVGFTCELDDETGEIWVTHFEGKLLLDPVKVN